MNDTVYIDIFYITNFFIDVFILYSAAVFLRQKKSTVRILLSAAISALISCVLLFVNIYGIWSLLFKAAITVLMILIAFGFKDIVSFLKRTAALFIAGSIFNGVINLLYQYTSLGNIMTFSNGALYINSPLIIVFGFVFIAFIVVKAIVFLTSWYKRKDVIYRVEIKVGDQSVAALGFLDSGNNLSCAISKKPVIVAEYEAVKPLIPPIVRECYKKGLSVKDFDVCFQNSEFQNRLRLVPFSTIENKGGMLIGFLCDRVIIYTKDKVIKADDIIIGVSSKNIGDGKYELLLSQKIFEDYTEENHAERKIA